MVHLAPVQSLISPGLGSWNKRGWPCWLERTSPTAFPNPSCQKKLLVAPRPLKKAIRFTKYIWMYLDFEWVGFICARLHGCAERLDACHFFLSESWDSSMRHQGDGACIKSTTARLRIKITKELSTLPLAGVHSFTIVLLLKIYLKIPTPWKVGMDLSDALKWAWNPYKEKILSNTNVIIRRGVVRQ